MSDLWQWHNKIEWQACYEKKLFKVVGTHQLFRKIAYTVIFHSITIHFLKYWMRIDQDSDVCSIGCSSWFVDITLSADANSALSVLIEAVDCLCAETQVSFNAVPCGIHGKLENVVLCIVKYSANRPAQFWL